MKSPHAYISVRPTLQIVNDYKVEIDFRPYTPSYIEMGGTTTKDQNEDHPLLMAIESSNVLCCSRNIVSYSNCLSGAHTDF